MHLFFARTIKIENLVRMKAIVLLRSYSHFFTSFLARFLRKTATSLHSMPSHETAIGVKWSLYFKHRSTCFFFFSTSTDRRTLSGVMSLHDGWCALHMRTSKMQSVFHSQKPPIRMSPRSELTSAVTPEFLSVSFLVAETPSESREGWIKGSSRTLDVMNPALAKQTRASRPSLWRELMSPTTLQPSTW